MEFQLVGNQEFLPLRAGLSGIPSHGEDCLPVSQPFSQVSMALLLDLERQADVGMWGM